VTLLIKGSTREIFFRISPTGRLEERVRLSVISGKSEIGLYDIGLLFGKPVWVNQSRQEED